MNSSSPSRRCHRLAPLAHARATLLAAGVVLLGSVGDPIALAGPPPPTLVVSRTYNGYERTMLPDGGYRPETFVFTNGGVFAEELYAGDSVTTIPFAEVAKTVAQALQSQNFVPTTDRDQAEQIIMIWYGSARRTFDRREPGYRLMTARKARILGFEKELNRARSLYYLSFARDFADEFDVDRYFVVLKAFDFQAARTDRQLKLLWESRFSIRRQGVDFVASLPGMAAQAAGTFGHQTNGIFRPDSHRTNVELGELEVVPEDQL